MNCHINYHQRSKASTLEYLINEWIEETAMNDGRWKEHNNDNIYMFYSDK